MNKHPSVDKGRSISVEQTLLALHRLCPILCPIAWRIGPRRGLAIAFEGSDSRLFGLHADVTGNSLGSPADEGFR
jgi:hypothetical protein